MNKSIFLTIIFATFAGFLFYLLTSCVIYEEANFDSLNFLFWNYGAMNGYIPYRDFFYPYGLVQYYLYLNIFATFLYASVLTVVAVSIGLFLKSLLRNRLHFSLALILVGCFLLHFVSFDTLGRYGSFVALGLLMANFILNKKRTIHQELLLGLSAGILFSLFLDQGVYGLLMYGLLSFGSFIFQNTKKDYFEKIKEYIYFMFIFGLGFVVGVLPFFIFLYIHEGLSGFVENTQYLAGTSKFAKVPFFPSVRNPDGIFVTVTLIISVALLTLRGIGKKFHNEEKILLVLTLVLLILQYKNTVRPFFSHLIFIALLMVVNSIAILLKNPRILKNKNTKVLFVVILIMIFIFPFPRQTFFRTEHDMKYILDRGNACYTKNTEKIYKEYESVKSDISGNVYSFPANPLIYPFLNQKLTYFLTTYEATSDRAQEKSIQYIQDNNVQTILFDSSSEAIQDGVPEVLRANTLLSYILTNFTIKDHRSNYFILQKNEKGDFFKDIPDNLDSNDFLRRFLDIPMGTIPLSEGVKFENIFYDRIPGDILVEGDLKEVNEYLLKEKTLGKSIFLVLKPVNDSYDMGQIDLYTDNIKTTIEFDMKKNYSTYLFNVARIPLFFGDRMIERIVFKGDAKFQIIQILDKDEFW